jgi:uncharacterized membrane protein YkvA (DUF1232 family)
MSNNVNTGSTSGFNLSSVLRDMVVAWRLIWDPRVPSLLKLLLPVLALAYWVSPIDLLPGMPFDDLAVIFLAAKLLVQLAPADAVQRAMVGRSAAAGPQRSEPADGPETIDTTWRVIED